MKANWIKIKTEYITSDISYRKLATKYKVSFSTLKTRAKRENWIEEREQTRHKIDTKVTQKTVEIISDSHAYEISSRLETTRLLNELIQKTLKDKKQFNKHLITEEEREMGVSTKTVVEKVYSVVDTKRLQALVNTLKTTNDIERQLLDVIDADKREKLNIDKEKIKVEKDKVIVDNEIKIVLEGELKEWGV